MRYKEVDTNVLAISALRDAESAVHVAQNNAQQTVKGVLAAHGIASGLIVAYDTPKGRAPVIFVLVPDTKAPAQKSA